MSELTDGTSGPDEPAFFGFEAPAATAAASPGAPAGYRVLARKYRPRTFDDLIGQDAMVRTVRNAFLTGRIPQAWMLTGVRGVGKTTTARILARGLNYAPADGAAGGPTVDMPELGLHCESIIESRHVDVIEVDAASHTGVENIRQITDSVRYAPAQARYKVYIIDEVHMLSTAAFNAFLKTLEEPPPHAKFVFATTEIRKVPVTILSRCQRFDLRRVESGTLVRHLERICAAEGVEAEPEALSVITRAAEGSVRDALSLLDQAVAHGAGAVAAASVRDMLGLADRGQVVDLFEHAMRGDMPAAFASVRGAYDGGADPAQILSDLAAFAHLVTRIKLVPEAARDPGLSEVERTRGTAFAAALSMRSLSRAWQILSKSVAEVGGAQRPLAAAEMALVRLAYAADLPTPDEALRALRDGRLPERVPERATDGPGAPPPMQPVALAAAPGPELVSSLPRPSAAEPSSAQPIGLPAQSAGPRGLAAVLPAVPPQPSPPVIAPPVAAPSVAGPPRLRCFEDVVALAGERREIGLKSALERDVRLVRFEPGHVELALQAGAPRNLPNELSRHLAEWTGERWVVAVSTGEGEATLHERRRDAEDERRRGAAAHPLVQSVLASFPGAEIVDVRDRVAAADETAEVAAVVAAAEPDEDDEA